MTYTSANNVNVAFETVEIQLRAIRKSQSLRAIYASKFQHVYLRTQHTLDPTSTVSDCRCSCLIPPPLVAQYRPYFRLGMRFFTALFLALPSFSVRVILWCTSGTH